MTAIIFGATNIKSYKRKAERTHNKGYTLIELVIVVAIMGILTAVAYPSYTGYIQRAHRTDAMETLNQIMAQQQRYVLRKRTFTTDLTDLGYGAGEIVGGTGLRTEDGFYVVTPLACGTGIARCVNLTATPVAGTSQVADGTLTLNSRGDKTWDGKVGWYHRESYN